MGRLGPGFTLIEGEQPDSVAPVEKKSKLEGFNILDYDAEGDRVRMNMKTAVKRNPDEYAKAVEASTRTGLPVGTVERNVQDVQQKIRYEDADLDRIRDTNPALWNYIKDEQKLSMIHDDLSTFEKLGKSLKGLKDYGGHIKQEFKQNTRNVRTGELNMKRIWAIKGLGPALTPAEQEELASLKRESRSIPEFDRSELGVFQGIVPAGIGQTPIVASILGEGAKGAAVVGGSGAVASGLAAAVFGQLGPQVATPEEIVTIPGAMIAGGVQFGAMGFKVGTAKGAFDLEGGLALEEFLEIPGIDEDMAANAAIAVGSVNAAFEYFSLGLLGKTFTPAKRMIVERFKKALKTEAGREAVSGFAKRYLAAVAGEGVTEFLQEMTTILGGEVLKEFGGEEATGEESFGTVLENFFTEENLDRGLESGLHGIQASILLSAPGTVVSYTMEQRKQEAASIHEQTRIDEIADAINESKVKERNKDTIREYMQTALSDNNLEDSVYIPAVELVELDQLDIANKKGKTYDAIREQLEEAVQRGGDVVIPISDFAADVMTDEATYKIFRDHIRLSNDTLTNNEAKTISEEGYQRVQRMVEDAASHAEVKAEADEIGAMVTEQLVAAGMAPEVARVQSLLYPAYVTTKAVRDGKTVKEVYESMGIRVEGPEAPALTEEQLTKTLEQSQYNVGLRLPDGTVEMAQPFEITHGQIAKRLGMNLDGIESIFVDTEGNEISHVEAMDRAAAEYRESLKNAPVLPEIDWEAFYKSDMTPGEFAKKLLDGEQIKKLGLKEFLKDSVVQQVVYHGTPTGGFEEFSNDKVGGNLDSGFLGAGFYLTDKPDTASYYANSGKAEAPTVMPVFIQLNNPYMWGTKTQGVRGLVLSNKPLPEDIHDEVVKRSGFKFTGEPDAAMERKLSETIKEVLIERGHDGVIAESPGATEYVTFTSNQIKSATGNRGTFDPASPNILFQGGSNDPTVYWHGSPTGDLRGGTSGLHLGTKQAAKEALEARIGIPAKGEWDGTREYGKTLLAGKNTMRDRGDNVTGYNVDAPDEDYYPSENSAKFSDGTPIPLTAKPSIKPFRIKGKMTNTAYAPHDDFKANAIMQGQKKKGTAKSGYYYKNVSEDEGSVSIVVPSGEHLEPVDDNTLFQTEDREGGSLGMYSGLLEAAKLLKQEKGKPDQMLAALKKLPKVKAEEIQWTGLDSWLASQEGSVTKQSIIDYLRNNGVQVEEIIATEDGERSDDLDWTGGTVWDESEAWDYLFEDLMSEYDGATSFDDVYWYNFDNWMENHIEDIVDEYDFPDDVYPELKSIADTLDFTKPEIPDSYFHKSGITHAQAKKEKTAVELDRAEHQWSEMSPDNRKSWYMQGEALQQGVPFYVDEESRKIEVARKVSERVQQIINHKDVAALRELLATHEDAAEFEETVIKLARDDAEEAADETARDEYYNDPQYIYEAEAGNRTLYIFGNNDYGYQVTEGNIGGLGTSIVNDTVYSLAEAQVQAREWAQNQGILEGETGSGTAAQWAGYVTPGPSENYREIKLTLPGVPGEFVESGHFDDPNIVAFLRVTDREFRASLERKTEGKTSLEEMRVDTGDQEYINKTYGQLQTLLKDATDADVKEKIKRILKRTEQAYDVYTLPSAVNTFHIDEFQSDWHQQGNRLGYSTGADAGEIETQANFIADDVSTILIGAHNSLSEQQANEISVQQFREFSWEYIRNGFTWKDKIQHVDDIIEMSPRQIVKDTIDAHPDKETLQEKVKQYDEIHARVQAERHGVPDAPFKKKQAWLELGLKRALLLAIEEGYEAMSWVDAQVLMQSRWSDKFEKMFTDNYNILMPSIVKKMTGIQPVHLTLDGEAYPTSMSVEERNALENKVQNLKDERKKLLEDFAYKHGAAVPTLNAVASRIMEQGVPHESSVNRQEADEFTSLPGWEEFYFKFVDATHAADEAANAYKAVLNKPQGYWTIPITPELKERVAKQGLTLFQPGNVTKGSITFTDQESLIRLTQAADLSTFLHETGHLFLEMEKRTADPNALTEDQRHILNFLGVNSFAEIEREHHEKWAKAFEIYLREGKAPSVELQNAFRRFAEWLKIVYQTITGLNVTLNDEVRGVMDRMLATDEQIAEVEALNNYQPMFTEATSGMTTAEFKAYQKQAQNAKDKPREALTNRVLKQLTRAKKKWWSDERSRLAKQIAVKLEEQPVYRAHEYMKAKIDTSQHMDNKVNSNIVDAMYDGDVPSKLKAVMNKDSINNPDDMAELFGFPDGKSMLDAIVNAKPIDDVAKELAEQQMTEKYGDILDPATLKAEAQFVAHNEERGELILTELRALAKRNRGEPAVNREIIKRMAVEHIAKLPVGAIRPDRFRRAEVRAAVDAQKMFDKGDEKLALHHKRQQAVNFYLYREAMKAQQKADSIRKRHQKLQGQKFNAKKFHPDFITNLKLLLSAYDFRKTNRDDQERSAARLARVNHWIKSQIEHESTPAPIMTNSVLQELKHWSDLTLAELQGLDDVVKSIKHLGEKMSNQALALERQNHVEVAAQIHETFKGKKPKADKGTVKRSVSDVWKSYSSHIFLHADQQLRRLDGYKHGIVYDSIKKIIDVAISEVLLPSQEKAGKDINEIYRKHYTTKQLRANNDVKDVPGTTKRMSKWERIALALNWGNESSRKAILESVKDGQQMFTEESVNKILNTLDKKDWDFVQDVWDYTNSYWPQLAAMEKRRKGTVPPKVEAMPITTRHGVYRGGYYPLKYDTENSIKVTEEQVEDLMKGVMISKVATARTRDGMLQERVGSGKRQVMLDVGVFDRHIAEVLQTLALAEPIEKVQRVLRSQPFREAMEATDNKDVAIALDVWLKDVAVGEIVRQDGVNKVFRRLRSGFSASKIGWNIGTILMQPLGLVNTMPVVGYGNTLKIMGALMVHPLGKNGAIARVQRASAFMRQRAGTFNKDVRDSLDNIKGTNARPSWMPDWAIDSLYAGIVFTQRYVDTVTWLAAYEQSKTELKPTATEADRMHFADRQVARSQASGVFADRTPIERGTFMDIRQSEWVRMWTALGSYFFAKGNIAHELLITTNFKNPQQAFKLVVDFMMLFVVEAVIIAWVRGMLPDDDDEETIAGVIADEAINSMLGTMPIIREIASESQGFESGPTVTQFVKEIGKGKEQVEQGEADMALFKAINNIGGTWFRYPSGQINRVVDSYVKDIQGEDIDPIDYLIYREKE